MGGGDSAAPVRADANSKVLDSPGLITVTGMGRGVMRIACTHAHRLGVEVHSMESGVSITFRLQCSGRGSGVDLI